MTSKPCDCSGPGMCPRHQIEKSEALFRICRSDEEQRAKWDSLVESHEASSGVDLPNNAVRAFRFTKAFFKAAINGFPSRDIDEINRIADICQTCEHFNGSACVQCGCRVNRTHYLNKIASAGQSCPIGKW